jgi:hypothetical protein
LRWPFVVKETSKTAHSIEKLKEQVPFLMVKSDWRATNPLLTLTISKNTSNKNFKTAILFNVIEKSGNYVFEDDNPHSPQSKGCKLCFYCALLKTKYL